MRNRLQNGALTALIVAAIVTVPAAGYSPKSTTGQAKFASKASSGGRRGRPRKFSRPSRAVTLTLPNDVIESLKAIDRDLSRAVVRAIQARVPEPPRLPTEVSTFGNRGVILVPPSRELKERTGVELVPLSDGRALISFDEQLSIPQFELRLGDAIADPTLKGDERTMFETLADILRNARRDEGVALRERSIIVLHWARPGAGEPSGWAGRQAESP